MINVRHSAEFIVENARSPAINNPKISLLAEKINHQQYALPTPEETQPSIGQRASETARRRHLIEVGKAFSRNSVWRLIQQSPGTEAKSHGDSMSPHHRTRTIYY